MKHDVRRTGCTLPKLVLRGPVAHDIELEAHLFRRIDRSQPKGVGHALDIFELLGTLEGPDEFHVTPAMTELVHDWDDVYEVYASQNWLRALDALETFADKYPEDVLAGIYLDRVVGFLLEPPPEAWDGVVRFSKK